MEVRQLLYFTKVMALRSFTKAASELRIAQPALGQQVRNLEQELGVTLLNRHSRGVEPTEAGLLLFERATKILEELRRTKEDIRELQGAIRGMVAIGITPGLGEQLAVPLVERCGAQFPHIDLNLVQDLSARLTERIAAETELSFAVVSGFELGRASDVVSETIAVERLFLVGCPDVLRRSTRPVRFTELADYRLILLGTRRPGRPHGLRRMLEEEARQQKIRLQVAHEMQSVTAVTELVERKLGVAILPLGTVGRRVAERKLTARPIAQPEVTREICLISSGRNRLSAADRAVQGILRSLVAELFSERGGRLGDKRQAAD